MGGLRWKSSIESSSRSRRCACETAGASAREALECRQAFGEPAHGSAAGSLLLVEAPDQSEMLRLGARLGYVRWSFRPVRGGLWRDTAEDDTLAADGGRHPPCPVDAKSPVGTRISRTRYRLGRVNRILIAR